MDTRPAADRDPSRATRCAVGVDLGGTKIAAAVIAEDGRVLARSRMATIAREGPEAVIERMAEAVREVVAAAPGGIELERAIGVGVPGQLDRERRTVLSAPNLPGWTDLPLAGELGRALDGRPVRLENDANLAALAEHRLGAGRGTEDFILLTVGTGIGGGIIQAGRLVRGSHGWAGELGHLIVRPDGPVCGMGHRGCLESLASGTAIARDAAARLGGAARLSELVGGDPSKVTAEVVGRAAREGDPVAAEIYADAAHTLGIGIASLVLALDPARFAVGGSVGLAVDLLLEPARETARATLFPAGAETLQVLSTELEGNAGLLGAALLILHDRNP